MRALDAQQDAIGFESLLVTTTRSPRSSLVGAGMRTHPGVSATFFEALADAGINVEMISTSRDPHLGRHARRRRPAGRARVHTAFGLDADGEAVVYGGTGR